MARRPNPLLEDFLDKSLPLPALHWETIPAGVNPWLVWEGYDEGIEGWVPVWFPTHDPISGRSYGEFERAYLFNEDLERIMVHAFKDVMTTATEYKVAMRTAAFIVGITRVVKASEMRGLYA